MARRRQRRSRSAGFTLLEMLFALVISLAALFLAGQLLLEAQSRMAHAARRAMDPVGEIAGQQLRADLRAAGGAQSPGLPGWSRDPLVLAGGPAGVIRYRKEGTDLLRSAGSAAGGRIVLRSVTTFRWRLRGASVEVDLRYRVTPRMGPLTSGGVREAPLPAEERLLLQVTPRGDGGRQW